MCRLGANCGQSRLRNAVIAPQSTVDHLFLRWLDEALLTESVERAVKGAGSKLEAATREPLYFTDDAVAVKFLIGQGGQGQESRFTHRVVVHIFSMYQEPIYINLFNLILQEYTPRRFSWGSPISREATVLTMASGVQLPGRVIFLNGGSSAGKTTLGRALQSAMPGPWLLLGIDLLIWTLPPEMINDPDGLSIHEGVITRGQLFWPLYRGFQHAVAALARSGVDVLIDDLTLDGLVDQQRWNNALDGLDVCWVGVRCAPQIAAEREARRATRLPGIARHQAESVHAGVHYDVEIDTGALDLHQELSVIAEALWQRWSLIVATDSNPKSTTLPRQRGCRRDNPSGPMGVLTNMRQFTLIWSPQNARLGTTTVHLRLGDVPFVVDSYA